MKFVNHQEDMSKDKTNTLSEEAKSHQSEKYVELCQMNVMSSPTRKIIVEQCFTLRCDSLRSLILERTFKLMESDPLYNR